jgi:phosphatidylethanolamine-binding protein (PEBP) family uncharacterized protein
MAAPRHTRRRRRRGGRSRKRIGGGSAQLTLKFPSGTSVSAGAPLLPQTKVEGEPTLSLTASATPAPKTIISWDPDAPAGTWLHWLVVNVPAASLDPSKGTTLVPWAPPTPPKGTGQHRYFFAVFDQGSSTPIKPTPPQGRAGFSVDSFVKTYGLRPVATALFKVAAPNSL